MNANTTAQTDRQLTDAGHLSRAYEAWAPELLRYAAFRTRDPVAAEDLVQDAFVRLAIQVRSSRIPTEPRAWLYRVVHNLIISESRRAAVARRRSPELSEDLLADSAEAEMLASEQDQALVRALQTLSATSRTCLLLAARGYTGREIAVVVGRSEGATRTLSCRARRVVRSELTRHGGALLAV